MLLWVYDDDSLVHDLTPHHRISALPMPWLPPMRSCGLIFGQLANGSDIHVTGYIGQPPVASAPKKTVVGFT